MVTGLTLLIGLGALAVAWLRPRWPTAVGLTVLLTALWTAAWVLCSPVVSSGSGGPWYFLGLREAVLWLPAPITLLPAVIVAIWGVVWARLSRAPRAP
jgi:hypothetical protein